MGSWPEGDEALEIQWLVGEGDWLCVRVWEDLGNFPCGKLA